MTESSDDLRLKSLAEKMRQAEYEGLSEKEIAERERLKDERRKKNIRILEDALDVCLKANNLQFSPEQMREARTFLPEDIEALRTEADGAVDTTAGDCKFSCENIDALVLAREKYKTLKPDKNSEPGILVLNMASATRPGGWTRKGADAQEEELCRRTSLLLSLESEGAKKYYEYNNSLKTHMGSDAVIISPCVEVVKDSSGETLAEPFPISVVSCAAPMIRLGLEGKTRREYEEMFRKRIEGMLLVAAAQNYGYLILGALGCGIYGNDAAAVSDLFYKAFKELPRVKSYGDAPFKSVDFAVLCRPDKDYNYKQFCRNFSSTK